LQLSGGMLAHILERHKVPQSVLRLYVVARYSSNLYLSVEIDCHGVSALQRIYVFVVELSDGEYEVVRHGAHSETETMTS